MRDQLTTRAFTAGVITPKEFGMLSKEAQVEFRVSGLQVRTDAPSLFNADENHLDRLVIAQKTTGSAIDRAEFASLQPTDQMEFVKNGGTIH